MKINPVFTKNLRSGRDLHIRNANVVRSAVLLDDDRVGFGGRVRAQDRRKGATGPGPRGRQVPQTVTNFRLDRS